MTIPQYDVIVIGAGAAGLTSAIYTCRKKLKTLIITVDVGGQTLLTNHIENYPGFYEHTPGYPSGPKLMQTFEEQAKLFGAEMIFGKANKLEKTEKGFRITLTNGEQYECRALILTYGKVPRSLGIPGEDKFIGRGVSTCATCLPPSELIIANSSARSIESVTTNDRVLTGDGTFQNVIEKMEREFDGNLIEIKTRFFTEPVSITDNHPVLRVTMKKYIGANYHIDFSEPEWVPAGMLRKDDIVLYPIIKEIFDKDHILISETLGNVLVENGFARNKHETFSAVRLPNKIKMDEDFMRLAGYYLAEGCITSRGVNLYFNKKEDTYIKDVSNLFENIFGVKPTVKIEGNVCRIMVFSKIICDLFEMLFGKYSYNKKVPHWFMMLPAEKQTELVKGIWRGDGCKRNKDFCIVTNSRQLTYQMRDILLRLGILPSINVRKLEQLKSTIIDGRVINFKHNKYHIIVGGPSLEKMSAVIDVQHEKIKLRKHICRHAFFKDGFVLLPIREIKSRHFKGIVQNMAIDKNNTYVAKNFIVHNCDAPLMRNKTVGVVGGGNSAVEAAELLTKFANKVYLIHRRDSFRADEITLDKVKSNPKVEFVLNSALTEIKGDKFVKTAVVQNVNNKDTRELELNGVFVEIGYIIETSFVKGFVKLNEANEIIVNDHCETGYPGIFAAGDLTNVPFKQTIISAGQGATAGLTAYNYLMKLEGKTGAKVDWG